MYGWYVEHNGRCGIFYYELYSLKIKKIFIDGEILIGIPSYVLYIPNDDDWLNNYPNWASSKKEEIIKRIKTKFKEPEYSYEYKI